MVYKEGCLFYIILINFLYVYIGEIEGDYNIYSQVVSYLEFVFVVVWCEFVVKFYEEELQIKIEFYQVW